MNSQSVTQTGGRKNLSKLNIAAISAAAAAAGIAGGTLIEALRRRPVTAEVEESLGLGEAAVQPDAMVADAAAAAATTAQGAAAHAAATPAAATTVTEEVVAPVGGVDAPISSVAAGVSPAEPVAPATPAVPDAPAEPAQAVTVDDVDVNVDGVVNELVNTAQIDPADASEPIFNAEAVGVINCLDGKEHIVAAGTLPDGTVCTMIDLDDDGVFDVVGDANLTPIAPLSAAYTVSDVNFAINEGNHYIPLDVADMPVGLNDDPSRDVADYTDGSNLNPSYGDTHQYANNGSLDDALAARQEDVTIDVDATSDVAAVDVDATETITADSDPLADASEDMSVADPAVDEGLAFDDTVDPTGDFTSDIIDA